jgi:ribonuclease inhibitor
MKKKPPKARSTPRKTAKAKPSKARKPVRAPKKAAPMRRAVIPAECATIGAVYDILARALGLPAHFGRNLDALYDTLTGDLPGPFEIVVEDAKRLDAALGPQGPLLLKLFADVAKARKDARIRL